jgi:hypothetical protein
MNFDAPAALKEWPSLNNEPISNTDSYLVFEGSLDECIRQFRSYEIHTAPQAELITAVLSPAQIVELARLRDFL